jgi:excisionase family DNA binding protein
MSRMSTPNPLRRLAHPINEAAELLAVDRRTVYRMLARGELRAVRVGARQRIPAGELERLLQPVRALQNTEH